MSTSVPDTRLWAVHVHGTADLIPMPDQGHAVAKAAQLSKAWVEYRAKLIADCEPGDLSYDLLPHIGYTVVPWPADAGDHTAALAVLRADDPDGWLLDEPRAPAIVDQPPPQGGVGTSIHDLGDVLCGTTVLSWDWEEQPPLDRVATLVRDLSGGAVHMHQVDDTGHDEYALIVAGRELSGEQIAAAWDRHGRGVEVKASSGPCDPTVSFDGDTLWLSCAGDANATGDNPTTLVAVDAGTRWSELVAVVDAHRRGGC